MTRFIPFSRDQAFPLPPDAKAWLPADDVAHFVAAAVERVRLGAFAVRAARAARGAVARAVVCAEGSQPILATTVVATPADAPSFARTILGVERGIGLPKTILADAGFAVAEAVATRQAQNIEPLVASGRTQPQRPYDVRPPPDPKPPRRITEPWRRDMLARQETEDAKARCARREQTVEPVFGIIKSALGLARFRLRGLASVTAGWTLITLA